MAINLSCGCKNVPFIPGKVMQWCIKGIREGMISKHKYRVDVMLKRTLFDLMHGDTCYIGEEKPSGRSDCVSQS